MFLVLLLVMIIMVVVTLMLPQITGLAKYTTNPDYVSKKREKLKEKESKEKSRSNTNTTYTYQAPDAELDADDAITSQTSAFSGVRSKLKNIHTPNITERDIPIKLELVGESELKRRVRKNDINGRITENVIKADPTSFDYDVDEFIDEENEKDVKESQINAQSKYGLAEV
jgi:hypothetical protein